MQNIKFPNQILIALIAVLSYQCSSVKKVPTVSNVLNEIVELKIKPSLTDSTIVATDVEHLVRYNPAVSKGKLLLFLPGTGGIPEKGPKRLFETAIEQGYQIINLSYINRPAVAQMCRGENLEKDVDCTEKFRTQRIFGTQLTPHIPDKPQDCIMNRFTKLLLHLKEVDRKGNWGKYLIGAKPNWDLITVAGQSQGGGMSAFIAQKIKVNRIITFSGGWDFSKGKEIANWYSNESVTPSNRWFGVYHKEEGMAEIISKTYHALAIPEGQIFPLDQPVREGKRAHGEGIRNVVYKDLWRKLFE